MVSSKKADENTSSNFSYYLGCCYLFFMYVRPQEYIPGASAIPTSGLIFLFLAIWGWFNFKWEYAKTVIIVIPILGVLFVMSGWGLENVLPLKTGFRYVTQEFAQILALCIIFSTQTRVKKLLNLWVIIYFLMSLITVKNGGRGPGHFTGDENDAALALAMGVPIVFYSIWEPNISKNKKLFRIGVVGLLFFAIAVTASRGGFLGAIAVILCMWWLSKNRIKRAVQAVAMGVALSGVVALVLPAGYFEEMESINDPEDDTRVERFRLWETGYIMFKHNPILGVGVGQYPFNAGDYQKLAPWYDGTGKNYRGKVVHSVYFQILSETGILGSLMFGFAMLYLPIRLYFVTNFQKVLSAEEEFEVNLRRMLIVSMFAYVISGAFIAVAYYPHIAIWLAMYVIFNKYPKMEK